MMHAFNICEDSKLSCVDCCTPFEVETPGAGVAEPDTLKEEAHDACAFNIVNMYIVQMCGLLRALLGGDSWCRRTGHREGGGT